MPRYESEDSGGTEDPGGPDDHIGTGQPPAVTPSYEQWIPGEFLVSLRDLDLVQSLLHEHLALSFDKFNPKLEPVIDDRGIQKPVKDDVEKSDSLGLARFRMTQPDQALATIKGKLEAAPKGESFAGAEQAIGEKRMPVSVLLAYIDDVCRTRYNGWTPVTAKNLVGHGVHGAPYISTGGASRYPRPARPGDVTIDEPLMGVTFDEPNWVNVGILDTALTPRPEFDGRWLRTGPDPVLSTKPGALPTHLSGHATFIAGMILQLAPNALLHVARVLHPEDSSAPVWDVAKAMMRLDKSVQVLNLSFSCYTGESEAPLALRYAIERLDPTTVVVAAAGNHGESPEPDPKQPMVPGPHATMWPAGMDRVVAVGSHDRHGNRSTFSPDVPWVHLTAFGEDVTSTFLSGRVQMIYRPGDEVGQEKEIDFPDGVATWSGTSFSSALVAGAIAVRTKEGPWAAQQAVREVFELSAAGEYVLFGLPLIQNPLGRVSAY